MDGLLTFGIVITNTKTIIMPICKPFLEIFGVLSRCYTCICLLYGASSLYAPTTMFHWYNEIAWKVKWISSANQCTFFIVGSLVAFAAFHSYFMHLLFVLITGESCSVEKELDATTATNAVYQDKTSILFSVSY